MVSSPFKHDNRFNARHTEIASDLKQILGLCGTGDVFLEKTAQYCLRVGQDDARLTRDVAILLKLFDGSARSKPTWSFNGHSLGPSVKLFFAFGQSPIIGSNGDVIRMQQKAFALPDKVLAGVMLHEATHFALGTKDHVYNWPVNRFSGLDDHDVYENADNWRIFYQRMRTHFRG